MTLKKNVVLERLAFLKETLVALKKLQELKKEDFGDFKNRWAAERGLHLAVEAVLDIGNHILVSYFNDRPANYKEIITHLARQKVLSEKLLKQFDRLSGFRNVLVHDYLRVDPDIIYDRIQNRLGDFEEFQKEIALWLRDYA
ncbi:MAG: DUF86 domain-containing protein [Deltaproteobacteria bacterium]|nr:DUF86 domain-containing protein [Deltaproteobacteria bacterium]